MVLVDTSIWIDFFAKPNSPSAIFMDRELNLNSPFCINAIVEMEILQGIKNEQQHGQVRKFLEPFQYFPNLTRNYFEKATEIYRGCRKRGMTVRRSLDCLIAANCLIDDLAVAHRDRDFDAIAKVFKDLRVIRPDR